MRVRWVAVAAVLCAGISFLETSSAEEPAAAPPTIHNEVTFEYTPFWFVYGGEPVRYSDSGWERTESKKDTGEGRVTTVRTYTHTATQLKAEYEETRYENLPDGDLILDWVVTLRNDGKQDTPIIQDLLPLSLGFQASPDKTVLHYNLGDSNSADSFAPREHRLSEGPITLSAKGGRSSDGNMPFFLLHSPDCIWGFAVGWSGQWEAKIQRAEYHSDDSAWVRIGMPETHFKLHPGESVRTPRIVQFRRIKGSVSDGHNLFRQLMLKHYLPKQNGQPVWSPICASVTEMEPDGSYEGPHLRAMEPLAQRGVEVFWSDMDPQQWYPKGFPEGTGTWDVDTAKYPRGLKPIGDAAHAAGLKYLLWFEPERVAPGTRIATEHPEWVTGGEKGGLFKLHIPEARRWLTDYIDKTITDAGIDWIRWDFNIEPLGYWEKNDEPDRVGITEMKHIEGLYAMWDELEARHPGLLVDICASGGRRIDIETCKRGLPLWHSDLQCSGPHPAADQLQNGGLFRWIPMHGGGDFALEPSYVFRSAMTAGNILAPTNAKGVLSTADPDTEQAVKSTVAIYKKVRPYMLGDFYPLFPHVADETVWYGYQFHLPDSASGVAFVFRREKAAEAEQKLALQGIDVKERYTVSMEGSEETREVSGEELQNLPVTIGEVPGAVILYYAPVK